jgi:hypothetical protein
LRRNFFGLIRKRQFTTLTLFALKVGIVHVSMSACKNGQLFRKKSPFLYRQDKVLVTRWRRLLSSYGWSIIILENYCPVFVQSEKTTIGQGAYNGL